MTTAKTAHLNYSNTVQYNMTIFKSYHHHVQKLIKQPKLTWIIQSRLSRRLTLFWHIEHMDDNAHAKRILLASTLADWRRQPGRHCTRGWAPSNKMWDTTTLRSLKQWIWFRTALCGGRCQCMVVLCNLALHAKNDDYDRSDIWNCPLGQFSKIAHSNGLHDSTQVTATTREHHPGRLWSHDWAL